MVRQTKLVLLDRTDCPAIHSIPNLKLEGENSNNILTHKPSYLTPALGPQIELSEWLRSMRIGSLLLGTADVRRYRPLSFGEQR